VVRKNERSGLRHVPHMAQRSFDEHPWHGRLAQPVKGFRPNQLDRKVRGLEVNVKVLPTSLEGGRGRSISEVIGNIRSHSRPDTILV